MKVKALKVIKNSFVTMANAKTVLTTLTSFESQVNGGGVMGGGEGWGVLNERVVWKFR